jgi:sugar lactone lactonase YvrE
VTTAPDPDDLGPVTLYYLNVTEALVMSVGADGGEPVVVVEEAGQGPDGVAVDVRRGHIYWTNMGVPAEENGFIQRSDLDGSNVTTIIEEGSTFTPKQLKLEPETKKLYWSDREGMRVQRSNLDGSELETLVTIAEGDQARADRSNHAVGISVDTAGGYFYWIQKGPPDGGEGSIRRAHLELPEGATHQTRTDVEVLYAGLPEPIDLDVDVDAAMMYWSDRGDGTINRAPVDVPVDARADTRNDREILAAGVDVAIGIWLDRELGHIYYTGTDVVGRMDLDGANATTLVDNAGILTGITAVRLP